MTGLDRSTRIRRSAVDAVLAHRTLDDAADACGVSPRTLRRWRADDDFARAVRERSQSLSRDAHDQLRAAQVEAVDALRAAMRDGTPATRVRAARAVLEVAMRHEASDLDQRIADVEGVVRRWDAHRIARRPSVA